MLLFMWHPLDAGIGYEHGRAVGEVSPSPVGAVIPPMARVTQCKIWRPQRSSTESSQKLHLPRGEASVPVVEKAMGNFIEDKIQY